MNRLLRTCLLCAIPFIVLPTLLTRRGAAKRLPPSLVASSERSESMRQLGARLQALVDELKERLDIASPVVASLVPTNRLVVSVQRMKEREGAFSLLIEEGFAVDLTDQELRAVVAHELGHVWIFTHHPYLHTEELANQIALRLVGRDTLSGVYEKVWKRAGQEGSIVYLPLK